MGSLRISPHMTLLAIVLLFTTNALAIASVLGVDFGTEYIKAALVKPGTPLDIVLTKDTRRKETSAVAFKLPRNEPRKGQFPERAYGADAMALAARIPGDVYPNLKTILALKMDNPHVQNYASRHPSIQIQPHPVRGTPTFQSKAFVPEEGTWTLEELLAMELQAIQKNAEVAAGASIHSIVLTVPPFYTTEEKRAIQAAAELANLKVLSLISDGLAVGLNFATSREFPNVSNGSKPEYHVVFDMGAGSTKATVMKFQGRTVQGIGKLNKTVQEVQVIGAGWDRSLGGDSLNHVIIDDMVTRFIESEGAKKIQVTAEKFNANGRAIAKLTNQVEKIRHVLSANQNMVATFESLFEGVDFKYKITRAEFEEMTKHHAERISTVLEEALKIANLDMMNIDSIILHGGATRTPFVHKALEKSAGSSEKIRSNVNSDEAAVFGAGFRAADISPSFRVKEIRISEGPMYPVGLRWTTPKGKTQHQRIWSAISQQGGVPKELTFSEFDDFTATFYQQIGSEEQDVKKLTTKNLTATLAAIKETHPTCVESEIQFKLGVKLAGENGEVQVVKAAVECEAEVKDGFVDGVKNLFGFGKKDQKPLVDDKSEGSEEVMKKDAVKESSSTESSGSSSTASSADASGADSSASNSAEKVKPQPKKREIVRIPVEVTVEKAGTPDISKAEMTKYKDRLRAFAVSDRMRVQREETLNRLEGYAYQIRDFLESEAFIEASTEKERSKLAELASETSGWLYGDGAEASKEELKAKLKVLEKLVIPIQKKVDESAKRPERILSLKNKLEIAAELISKIMSHIEEHERWRNSASASTSVPEAEKSSDTSEDAEKPISEEGSLKDEDSTKIVTQSTEVKEEKSSIPLLYAREDLDDFIALYKSTLEWLNDMEPKQAALAAVENPVLLVKDLEAKAEKLDKASVEIARKGTKKMQEMSRQAKKASEKTSKKSKTASARGSEETMEFKAEDFMKDGKLDKEELERLVERAKAEKAKQEEAERKATHDEL